jgi:hypothetical protein
MEHPNPDNYVVLIVPPSKKNLVFDPRYRNIFGDFNTGVYIPVGDEKGNWIYRLPLSIAERIQAAFPELDAP